MQVDREEVRRRFQAGTAADLWLVSGVIVNDPNGPLRWCEWFEALSARMAEDDARAHVAAMVADGLHGVLVVANVLQIQDGMPAVVDSYAVYGDDPDRPRGYAPARGWSPPAGFEGLP